MKSFCCRSAVLRPALRLTNILFCPNHFGRHESQIYIIHVVTCVLRFNSRENIICANVLSFFEIVKEPSTSYFGKERWIEDFLFPLLCNQVQILIKFLSSLNSMAWFPLNLGSCWTQGVFIFNSRKQLVCFLRLEDLKYFHLLLLYVIKHMKMTSIYVSLLLCSVVSI